MASTQQGAVRMLLPLLGDREVAYKVAWALGEVGNPAATSALIQTLKDTDALTRVSAIGALVKLRAIEAIPALRELGSDDAVPNAGDRVPVSRRALEAIAFLQSVNQPSPAAVKRPPL